LLILHRNTHELSTSSRADQMTSPLFRILFALVMYACSGPVARSGQAARDLSLDIRWSIPLPANTGIGSPAVGFQVWDAAPSPAGGFIVFGVEAGSPAIALGANENGLGPITGLKLEGFAYRATVAPDGSVWVGGRANQRAYAPGTDSSDAYLAHVSRDGRLLAEHTFGAGWLRGRLRTVVSLAIGRSGSVAIVARDGSETWAASVAPFGELLWERRFGAGKGATVAILPAAARGLNGRIPAG
jgi:hypothetical protein